MPKLTSDDIAALYEEHSRSILRYLMRRSFDAQVSIDLLSETFAVAYEKRGRLRGDSPEVRRSWLFGIASNLLADYFRSGAIERRAMQRVGVDPVEVLDHEVERIEDLAGVSELRAAVADALTGLSEENQEALRLRVIDELPYPEVAARMAVTEQVARARVSRGLRKLRDRIDELELEGVPDGA